MLLNYLLESEKSIDCNSTNVYSNNTTITVNLLIDSIEKSLDIGYYLQAIEMLNNLKNFVIYLNVKIVKQLSVILVVNLYNNKICNR